MTTRRGLQFWVRIAFSLAILTGVSYSGWLAWRIHRQGRLATECREAIRLEDWDRAQPLAEQWVRLSPDDADGWLSLADVAKHKGDLRATEECLGRISPNHELFLTSQTLRGDLLLDGLRRPDQAIRVWKEMLTVSPNANVAHQRLLYVYSMTLQRESLVKQIREAIRIHAEPAEAYGYILAAPNLVFTDGYLKIGQWLQENPKDETLRVAQAIYAARTSPSRGMRLFGPSAIQPGDASGVNQCLKDFPDNLELRAFVIEKAIADADITALGKGLQNLPPAADRDSRFWRYIGALRDAQRRHAEAAEAFRQSIQLHPMDWKSHHELGVVERVLGHTEIAARHAELGDRGKQLEREILELPNAAQVDETMLQKMQRFAQDCGDQEVADGLTFRLNP